MNGYQAETDCGNMRQIKSAIKFHIETFGEPDISKFSFKKARKLLESYKGSLSDAIIEERRDAV